jgi:hypothetical protein
VERGGKAGERFLFPIPLALLAAVLLTLAIACSDDDAPAVLTPTAAPETPAATAAPSATPEPTPRATPVARLFTPEMEQQVRQVLTRVGEVRGTPPKGPVAMQIIERGVAVDYFRASYDQEAIADIRTRQAIYALLGLIPRDTDLLSQFLTLLGVGITGFYDPELDSFYLIDGLGVDSPIARTTIVHELAHALQDQYRDLDAVDEERKGDWDAGMAAGQAIEGDAVNTEILYSGTSLRGRVNCFTIPIRNMSPGTPYVVVRELNSSYDDGLCFVQAVLPRVEGPQAILDRLPATTEQVLHPEKYLAGEGPIPVKLAALETALGSSWQKIDESNFGEFTVQNILYMGLTNREQVARAAAGWGGDHWTFYGRDDGMALLQYGVSWDTDADALDFWETLVASLVGRGAAVTVDPARPRLTATIDGVTWRAKRSEGHVLILVSTDAASAETAARALDF